ncbi:MAG: AGE family epimerase/isomerase [Lachnospiraceae bacterium]|nr:AGE family epimerase/isomerase [Lachnospiraceae bacterium]
MADLEELYRACRAHLRERLLPFWSRLRDEENGGYYGLVTDDLVVHRDAEKGCILNSRILWFFSECYRALGDEAALEEARHAYRFLTDAFLDKGPGGVYWSVTADGRPLDDSKHCYCQAFAIYALASFAQAENGSDATAARKLAEDLYRLIETKMRDAGGYGEAFTRDLRPASNEKLSENGVEAARTMNTALHVLEAYTELYMANGDPEVKQSLMGLLDLFLDRIYLRDEHRLGVFFDKDYHSLIDLYSYGHDIEAAWLIDRALDAVGDYVREPAAREMTATLTEAVYRSAYREEGTYASLLTECERGVDLEARVWWIQAEAVNGFLNGMQAATARGDPSAAGRYAEAADKIWKYICDRVIDPRPEGEWFWFAADGGHDHDKPVVDPWKCPYHNGRMCMEVMRRLHGDGKE